MAATTRATNLLTALPELLHDAVLERVTQRGDEVSLFFHCLRRDPDGGELRDGLVELRLHGVVAVAIAYEMTWPSQRPSQVIVPEAAVVRSLDDWRPGSDERGIDVEVGMDSLMDREALATAARTDWVVANADVARAARHSLALASASGIGPFPIRVWIAFDGADSFTAGEPLSIERWRAEYEAWWAGWEKHWTEGPPSREEVTDASEPVEEDTMIPAATDPPADLTYRPPPEPAVELEPTDVPSELLAPIRAFFTAPFEGNWRKAAQAYRDLDVSLEEQAKRLEAAATTYDFGRWAYARAVDEYWREGRCAFVRVRGVEHSMPIDGESAENLESVWDFALVERDGAWFIRGYSQGWPCHESAARLPADQKPWLTRWRSGSVR